MSNVLIGIIGVILFIGLALAGALFLGPRFQESTNTTKAARIVSDMQQITAAVNMYRLREGAPLLATDYTTNVAKLMPGYLKTEPLVATSGLHYETVDVDGGNRAMPIHHIQAIIGSTSDTVAKAVCRNIEASTGAADPDAAIAAISTTAQWTARVGGGRGVGCFEFAPVKAYYAFMVF